MKNNGKTSRAEFRAIIAIAGMLALTISFPFLRDLFFPVQATSESALALTSYLCRDTSQASDNQTRRASYQSQHYLKQSHRSYKTQVYSINEKRSFETRDRQYNIACRAFDPNSVKKEDLIAMGVSNYVTGNLIKYRESGAKFRKADDLRKIYGMDSTLFTALISCIEIQSDIAANTQPMRNTTIDINSASLEEWQGLPGIGAVLASRIIKYREYLGGFHMIQQVGETYGLPPETLQQITSRLVIGSEPRKLNLNTATPEELAGHPYITQRQAEAIVNFRNHHGNFSQIEDVLKIYSLNDEWFARMVPYLACNTHQDIEEALAAR